MEKDNVLLLNKLAKQREAEGHDVINGSIGMMYFDDGHLPKNLFIRETLSKHVNDDDLTYSSISGETEFRDLLAKWFFDGSFNEDSIKTMGTQGGTGAVFLSSVQENLRNSNNILLFPNIGWPNYYGLATSYHFEYYQYPMFDDELHFNLKGILDLFDKYKKEGKHISFIINDPCHNPTGYSLSREEWDSLVDYLMNNMTFDAFTLIVDCAYLDFADKDIREYAINCIKKISHKFTVHMCLSCSKTFSLYGLRCGELVSICPNKEVLEDIMDRTIKIARGAWSTPNHMAMNTVIDVLSSEKGRKELTEEIEECNRVIKNRADIFFKEAKEKGLVYLPYKKGFFVTLVCDNAYQISEDLMEQDIFLAPISNKHLRVALCSIPTNKMIGLAKAIKEAMEK